MESISSPSKTQKLRTNRIRKTTLRKIQMKLYKPNDLYIIQNNEKIHIEIFPQNIFSTLKLSGHFYDTLQHIIQKDFDFFRYEHISTELQNIINQKFK